MRIDSPEMLVSSLCTELSETRKHDLPGASQQTGVYEYSRAWLYVYIWGRLCLEPASLVLITVFPEEEEVIAPSPQRHQDQVPIVSLPVPVDIARLLRLDHTLRESASSPCKQP